MTLSQLLPKYAPRPRPSRYVARRPSAKQLPEILDEEFADARVLEILARENKK